MNFSWWGSLDTKRNCEKTNMLVKESEKNIKCKKKGIFNLAYKLGPLFEKSRASHKFKDLEIY